MRCRARWSTLLVVVFPLAGLAQTQRPVTDIGEVPSAPPKLRKIPGFSPYAGRNYPTRVYWGDEHVHSGWSADAGAFGCTLGPEEAMRFARGEEVVSSTGTAAKLARPLDWLALTDHSDGMGVIFDIKAGRPELMTDPTLKRWHDMMAAGQGVQAAMEMIQAQANRKLPAAVTDPKYGASIWARNTEIVDKYNQPGRFTAFIGYEWTPNAGGGDNLHRNVIYGTGRRRPTRSSR